MGRIPIRPIHYRMRTRTLLELDARLTADLHVADRPGTLRTIASVFARSGDSWFWGLALVCVWWLGSTFWKQWAIVMLASISVLAALVMGLKFVIRRRRPAGDWGGIYRNTDPHSFPSGHAARAFLIAVIAAGLGPAWAALALWVWAPLVSAGTRRHGRALPVGRGGGFDRGDRGRAGGHATPRAISSAAGSPRQSPTLVSFHYGAANRYLVRVLLRIER